MNKLKTFALMLIFLLYGLYGRAQYQETDIEFNGANTALTKDGQDYIYRGSHDGTIRLNASRSSVTLSTPATSPVTAPHTLNVVNLHSVIYDGAEPVVTHVDVPAARYYYVGEKLIYVVHFDQNVTITGNMPSLTILIGTTLVNAVYVSGNGTRDITFSYVIVSGDFDDDGIVTGTLVGNGGTISDGMGNPVNPILFNTANTSGVRVNALNPVVTLTTAKMLVNGPFSVQMQFTEAVTDFTVSDLTVTNATLSDLQTTDNIVYTVLVTPFADGNITLELPADAADNLSGYGNLGSNLLQVNYDATAPVISSVLVPPNSSYRVNDVLNFIVFTNEVIDGSGLPYLDVIIGGATRRATIISGFGTGAMTFFYTVQEGDLDLDGVSLGTHLVLNGATITDNAGNDLIPALQGVANTTGIRVNTRRPSVVLSSIAAANVNAPYPVTITFSEAVTGFDAADLIVVNGTAGSLQTTDDITYTATITPTADGNVTLQLPANAADNIGGNGNTASNNLNIIYDATPPVISSVDVPASGYYKANDVLIFRVNTSEVIAGPGVPYLEVVIGGITHQAAYISGLGTNALIFSYVVQEGDMDMDGIMVVGNLAPNGITLKDASGNALILTLQNSGSTSNVFVNTSHPAVTISTTGAARVNASYPITITFSEAVTDFALTDLTVTNATVSALQTINDITYTVTVTPAADGAVTISLPADQAVNIASNGNRASNTLSNIYDGTPPMITASQQFSVMERDPAGTVIGTAAATEASGTLQNWAIANDPTGGAFAISASGVITLRDAAILDNHMNTTVTVALTVSDGLNTSTPTGVAIRIIAVNKAPFFDAVTDKAICITTATQTFPVTGATATEAGQTFGFTISADQQFFDALTIDAAGLVSYKLKATATGSANITITIKDNGGIVNGGIDVFQRTFALTVNSLPVITVTSNTGTNVSKGDVVQLTASGAATYNWGTATGAVFNARPQANTTYQVTGTSASGCSNTAQISLTTIEDFKVDAVNILTPNGDGINDRWVIRNIDTYPNNELKIFDRTGRIIFQRRNYSNDWDGTMNGRKLVEGTYYYILTIDGSGRAVKGYITIISDQK